MFTTIITKWSILSRLGVVQSFVAFQQPFPLKNVKFMITNTSIELKLKYRKTPNNAPVVYSVQSCPGIFGHNKPNCN